MENSEAVNSYISQLPDDRKFAMQELRKTFLKHLPEGFSETITYGMISYVVSHQNYPAGYHCDPKQPLPFISIASQKNFIALYHMGLYADKNLHDWFVNEYQKHVKTKLDMGKSCIRFKKPEQIPFDLIAQLAEKINPQQWIEKYETELKK